MFNKEIKDSLIEFNQELLEIEEYYKEYEDRFISKIKPQKNKPKRMLGQNGFHYIQLTLHRSRALFEGFVTSVNSDNPLLAFLAARAHFEVTGVMCYFYKKLNDFYNDKITYDEIEETLHRLTFGTKDSELKSYFKTNNINTNFEPIGVMSYIDAADDLFRKESGKKENIFRDIYDKLCEYCHPNYNGIIMSTKINKVYVARYDKLPKFHKRELLILYWIPISLSNFIDIYDRIMELLKEHEELPIIM